MRSEHRRQDAIGRAMAVEKGLDVDDDLFTHVDAAFESGRAEMRQQHHLAGARELDQLRAQKGWNFSVTEKARRWPST
jgi:hypothetical protein